MLGDYSKKTLGDYSRTPTLNVPKLRGMMAEHRVTTLDLADLSGVSKIHINRILREVYVPGELATIKIGRALERLERLGIDTSGVLGAETTDAVKESQAE